MLLSINIPPPRLPPGPLLIVQAGHGQPERTVAVLTSPFRIGRDPACDLVLDNPTVSAVHATLVDDDGGFRLTGHSSNGVWVNGERIDGSCRLTESAELSFATAAVYFHWVAIAL